MSTRTCLFLRLLAPLVLTGAGCVVEQGFPGRELPPPAPGFTDVGGVAGRVVDAAGAPVVGAFVTLDPSGIEAVTDPDGRWSVERVLPGSFSVVAAAAGYVASRSEEVEVVVGEVAEVDVVLTRPPVTDGYLRISVVGPDGLAAVGAEVLAVDGGTRVSGTVDDAGFLELGGLGGATVELTIGVPERRIVERTVQGVAVPTLGATALAVTLAGRGEPDAHIIGSRVCGYCHLEQSERWGDSAHAEATTSVVGAPSEAFDEGLVVDLGDASATFSRDLDGSALLVLEDASGASDAWTVAGFLGGPARGAIPWGERDGLGWPLPVAWVPADPRAPALSSPGWVAGDRAPWFRADDRFAYTATPEVERSAESACFACHVTGTALAVDGDGRVTMHGLSSPSVRYDEGAVACEACHGPGETHSAGPLDEKAGSVTVPDDLGADRANDVCGQCHAAMVGDDGLPFAWTASHGLFRPGDTLSDLVDPAFDTWPTGSAAVPNATLDELRVSKHGQDGWNAGCVDCHDPHGSDQPAELRLPVEDDQLCASCHLGLTFGGDPSAAAVHTGHASAVPCVGCHLPATAARLAFDDRTGAGDLSSHLFVATPPAATVADFDAAGAGVLALGTFTPDTCLGCHVATAASVGGAFPGPLGDPTVRETHVELQSAFEELYP